VAGTPSTKLPAPIAESGKLRSEPLPLWASRATPRATLKPHAQASSALRATPPVSHANLDPLRASLASLPRRGSEPCAQGCGCCGRRFGACAQRSNPCVRGPVPLRFDALHLALRSFRPARNGSRLARRGRSVAREGQRLARRPLPVARPMPWRATADTVSDVASNLSVPTEKRGRNNVKRRQRDRRQRGRR
jgi:hypothetical protein